MTTYPIIHEPNIYQYDEGVFVWFDETGGVGGASNYLEEAKAQMKRYANGMGSIDRTEQLAATCEELRLELDNERQYQVSMEYLYALDEEVVSDLKKHIEQLDAKLTKAGVVALETILNERGPVFDAMVDAAEDAAGKDVSFNVVVGRAIRAALTMLAELESK